MDQTNSVVSDQVDPAMANMVIQRSNLLLTPEYRPPDDEPLFIAIENQAAGKLQYFIIKLSDENQRCLLLFTSQIRAHEYIRVVLGNEVHIHFPMFSPNDCASSISSWRSSGLNRLVVDRCPYCDVMNIIHLDSLSSPDDFIKLWAGTSAVRFVIYNRNLDRAQNALSEGRLSDAYDMAIDIVQHVDAERPEVHFLLGCCGLLMRDEKTVNEAFRLLHLFAPHWTDELKEQEIKRKQMKIKGIDYQ
jgi:hypothetical protein